MLCQIFTVSVETSETNIFYDGTIKDVTNENLLSKNLECSTYILTTFPLTKLLFHHTENLVPPSLMTMMKLETSSAGHVLSSLNS